MLISEILRTAKARLTPEIWGQATAGESFPLTGKECVAMAIQRVCDGDSGAEFSTYAFFASVVMGQRDYLGVPFWNDAPGRTLAEVHAAFDAAIAIAEQEEAQPKFTVTPCTCGVLTGGARSPSASCPYHTEQVLA